MEYLEKARVLKEIDNELEFWNPSSEKDIIARSYDECMILALETIRRKIDRIPTINGDNND